MKNIVRNLEKIDHQEHESQNQAELKVSNKILRLLLNYRRTVKDRHQCSFIECPQCQSHHLPKILASVIRKEPIRFVLPAFPGKSPNPSKVLGPLPDYAEKLSLSFLDDLCSQVKGIYPPGMKVIICSDGRVFSDIVKIKESDVSAYQKEIATMIKEISSDDISLFNLDDVFDGLSFNQMRDQLMKRYGTSKEILKYKVKNGASKEASFEEKEANQMYRGITKFLFEDSLYPGQTKSRSALQKNAKSRAYEVIRRSNAWSELIEELFPKAVRLSIHPQACGAKKLGIRLIGNESWMTPWHGVAVETSRGFSLLKRSEAEKLGAKVIYDDKERPSHFKLLNKVVANEL